VVQPTYLAASLHPVGVATFFFGQKLWASSKFRLHARRANIFRLPPHAMQAYYPAEYGEYRKTCKPGEDMRSFIGVILAAMGLCIIAYTASVLRAANPVAVPATPVADAAVTTFSGVLIDNACSKHFTDKDDPETAAAAHPKSCALKPACAASGYCLISGKKVIKFDDASNKMAKDYLEKKDSTTKVNVQGTLKDDVLSVTSIEEAKEAAK
jgi:hypothetical protein